MIRTRRVRPSDAEALAQLLQANREYLAPWEPRRDASYFTASGQSDVIERALAAYEAGRTVPQVILADDEIVGRITLSNIVGGAARFADIGYWVGQAHTGRGAATEAVGQVTALAFSLVGLHRVQAATLVHNVASQRVLVRNGYVQYGLAPSYLNIDGAWQDHLLFQRINPDDY